MRQSSFGWENGNGELGETNGELARENDATIGIRDYAERNLSVWEYTRERNIKKVIEKRRFGGTSNLGIERKGRCRE